MFCAELDIITQDVGVSAEIRAELLYVRKKNLISTPFVLSRASGKF